MGLQNNKNLLRVDYLHEEKERTRLFTYLRDENIRRLSGGEGTLSEKIKRRRFIVILLAAAVILTGSLFLFL